MAALSALSLSVSCCIQHCVQQLWAKVKRDCVFGLIFNETPGKTGARERGESQRSEESNVRVGNKSHTRTEKVIFTQNFTGLNESPADLSEYVCVRMRSCNTGSYI